MEKAYWLNRQRTSLKAARSATSNEARLIHYDLAGHYSIKAAATESQPFPLADSLPLPIYATGSNPSFDDADDT